MIYLDNAATTLKKPQAVIDAVVQAMTSLGNSGRGAYEDALAASRTIYETRRELAALVGCAQSDHVVFTANSTEALNLALCGVVNPGDHILSTVCEHNSVLRPLYRLRSQGAAVDFLPADRCGRIDYDDLPRLLRPETKVIVCTHGSNLTGNLLDIERIGAFAHRRGLLFIVDASQTAGVFPIHMAKMHIDILCFTGHKSLMGPQGTGGLAIAPGVEIRPWKVGGTGVQSFSPTQPSQYPTRLEAGTLNGHGLAGLHAALLYAKAQGWDVIRRREQALARRFYEGVVSLPSVTVYGDYSAAERAPIVSLNIGSLDSASVSDELAAVYHIATRPGAHCAPLLHQALGTQAQGAVRFSFSSFNTEEEVDAAIRAIQELSL